MRIKNVPYQQYTGNGNGSGVETGGGERRAGNGVMGTRSWELGTRSGERGAGRGRVGGRGGRWMEVRVWNGTKVGCPQCFLLLHQTRERKVSGIKPKLPSFHSGKAVEKEARWERRKIAPTWLLSRQEGTSGFATFHFQYLLSTYRLQEEEQKEEWGKCYYRHRHRHHHHCHCRSSVETEQGYPSSLVCRRVSTEGGRAATVARRDSIRRWLFVAKMMKELLRRFLLHPAPLFLDRKCSSRTKATFPDFFQLHFHYQENERKVNHPHTPSLSQLPINKPREERNTFNRKRRWGGSSVMDMSTYSPSPDVTSRMIRKITINRATTSICCATI